MYMVMLVLDNQEYLGPVLEAWQQAGIRGATVIDSTGMHRLSQCRVRLHARFDFARIADECPERHNTIFALVATEEMARTCLEATEKLVGDLSGPDTGVFAAWPVAFVKGLPDGAAEEPQA